MESRMIEVCADAALYGGCPTSRAAVSKSFAPSLLLRLKGIIATWRYDSSSYSISLDASRHLYKSLSRAGRGFEGPIFTNSAVQCGVEPRDIYKPHFTPEYSQRVKRP